MSKFEVPRWLESELKRNLSAVHAPDCLWERIQNGQRPEPIPHRHWAPWAIAAVLTIATTLGTYKLPSPHWGEDVVLVSDTDAPRSQSDRPADWDRPCVPPGRVTVQVSNISAQRGHPFPLTVGRVDSLDCQACHSTGLIQHHL